MDPPPSNETVSPTLTFVEGVMENTARTSPFEPVPSSSKMHPDREAHNINATIATGFSPHAMVRDRWRWMKSPSTPCGLQNENKVVCLLPVKRSLASQSNTSVIRPKAEASRSA